MCACTGGSAFPAWVWKRRCRTGMMRRKVSLSLGLWPVRLPIVSGFADLFRPCMGFFFSVRSLSIHLFASRWLAICGICVVCIVILYDIHRVAWCGFVALRFTTIIAQAGILLNPHRNNGLTVPLKPILVQRSVYGGRGLKATIQKSIPQ